MQKILASFVSLALVAAPLSALASPGGTDDAGGHRCWTDCEQYGLSVGEYHVHDGDTTVRTYDNNEDVFSRSFAEGLHGRILLQVEQHGEAWYIRSSDSMRYYMKDGATAYEMMRAFSLGITDADLALIPTVTDTTEMKASESACSTHELAERLRGEILLQVEQHGEAWYVDPEKCRAIYMRDGAAAYEIMRYLGLGITDADLARVVPGTIDVEIVEPEPEPEPAESFLTFGDGTFLVGTDIQPGTYRNHSGLSLCYFERLSGFGGTLEEIIANELTSAPSVVTILASDLGFKSEDCGTWTTDLSAITDDMTSFADGLFIVGTDVTPGTYRGEGGDFCYWVRLSGFSHSFDDILANEYGPVSPIVTIEPTDVGFESDGCGTWSPVLL